MPCSYVLFEMHNFCGFVFNQRLTFPCWGISRLSSVSETSLVTSPDFFGKMNAEGTPAEPGGPELLQEAAGSAGSTVASRSACHPGSAHPPAPRRPEGSHACAHGLRRPRKRSKAKGLRTPTRRYLFRLSFYFLILQTSFSLFTNHCKWYKH